jgi:hypothetical protein
MCGTIFDVWDCGRDWATHTSFCCELVLLNVITNTSTATNIDMCTTSMGWMRTHHGNAESGSIRR